MLKLQPNVGSKDRMIRIIAGVAIVAVGLYFKSWWGAIGLLPIATAVLRWCPGYVPLNINTCEAEESQGTEK
ncbi:MAG: YgaP family membrane protein [Methylohalobius sp. ZOD2]